MKRLYITLLLVFILLLPACTSSNEEFVSDVSTESKVLELEEKNKELNSIIAERDDTIKELEMKLDSGQIETVDNTQENSNDSIPVLKIGETYSDDKIDVRISQIEYTASSNKGIQVYFEVVNKSGNPLESPGRLEFTLEDSKYEEELNRIGYTINFNPHGYIYQDEERKGSYRYTFE